MRSTAEEIVIKVFLPAGRHDYLTASELAEDYFQMLEAPAKGFIWFDFIWFEKPARYVSSSDGFSQEHTFFSCQGQRSRV